MKVEIGENNALLVFLEKKDVRALHLEINDTLHENEDARRILAALYRDAALESGFVPDETGNRCIELLPFEDGSVLICFSFRRSRAKMKVTARRKAQLVLFEFPDAAAFEQFLDSACSLEELPEAVYEEQGCYRFAVSNDKQKLINLLKEFAGTVRSPFALARTAEYWRRIY